MDKKKAIELLKQALAEISHLRELPYDNQEFVLWQDKVQNIINAALDPADYKRSLGTSPRQRRYGYEQEDYPKELERRETALRSIIQKHEMLGTEEKPVKKTEQKDMAKLPLQLFDALQLHPKVVEVSRSLFKTRNYASAILEAFKAVNVAVKKRAGSPKDRGTDKSLDGKNLMSHAFNKNKPLIKLNNLIEDFEKDEQEGFMFLFMGATVGIRNPKAHVNIVQKDPYKTIEYLGFASLLMKKIDFWKVD